MKGRDEYSLLLTSTLCLLAFGAIMVFSASSATGVLSEGGDGAYYLKRTAIFAAAGLLIMRLLAARGVAAVKILTPVLLVVSLGLLVAVLIPGVGQQANGSQRWIGAGLFQVQPAEVAKVALILYGAHLLAQRPKRARSLSGLMPALLVTALACLLIAAQPDLGTTAVACFGVFALFIAAGVRLRTLAPVAVVIAVGILVTIATHPYQQERLTGFLDPGADTDGAGFQVNQATIALGSGGLMGAGLGESVQKAFYLPEAHTDMVAAVTGEELGLAGMAVLICLYGLFGYAGFRAAHRARDRYSKLLAAGLTSLILAQAVINLFAVLGLAPLTGVTLPFVSYGGSSLIVTLACAGLLLNVAHRKRASVSQPAARLQVRSAGRTASRRVSRAPARLRVVEGGLYGKSKRSATGRHSRRRHGRARGARDRRRRRAAV